MRWELEKGETEVRVSLPLDLGIQLDARHFEGILELDKRSVLHLELKIHASVDTKSTPQLHELDFTLYLQIHLKLHVFV